MTIFRAPLANYKGEVMLSVQETGVVPAGAVPFRGMWVTINGLICATLDTGQARKFRGGIAFEDPSGLLILSQTSPTPLSIAMDGINVDKNGAIVTKVPPGSLVHQGVEMTVSEPGGPMVVNQDEPPLTFLAPLERGVNSAAIEGVGTRDSEATYWAEDGRLKVAAVNEIRQEFQNGQPLGTLMEPASTNKLTCFNANPDAALTGFTLAGDPAATFTRVDDTSELERTGKSGVCTSGYVFKLDNSAGSSNAELRSSAVTNNTNLHSQSAYWRGSGTASVGLNTGAPTSVSLPTHYERTKDNGRTPTSTTNRWTLFASAGAVVYFILPQMEEQPIVTSVIIVEGAAAGRAVDQLNWPLTDPLGRNILNQTEGMTALLWRPHFSKGDAGSAVSQRLTSCDTAWLFYSNSDPNGRFGARSGAAVDAFVNLTASLQANDLYVIAMRWSSSNFYVGYKSNGAWVWSTAVAFSGINESGVLNLYDIGSSSLGLGGYCRDLYIWSEDKGTAWLESFFSGVAN